MHWHILGQKYMMSNFDLIACDVNLSNSLTTLDLAETRAIILHMQNQFNSRKAVDFVSYDYTGSPDIFSYSNSITITPAEDYSDLDFTAIKLGDASRNWVVNKSANGRRDQLKEIELILEKEQISQNKVKVPIKVQDANSLVGLQFTLSWNPDVYNFEKLTGHLVDFHPNLEFTESGRVTVSWNHDEISGLSLNSDAILSFIEFSVKNEHANPEIEINSGITPALAFNSDLEIMGIASRFVGLEDDSKITIYPKPADDQINIVSSNRGLNKYSILNASGATITSGLLNTSNEIKVDHLKKGMYILQIAGTGNRVIIEKFLKK